jgi:energy-converting hydrogenase A subunit M
MGVVSIENNFCEISSIFNRVLNFSSAYALICPLEMASVNTLKNGASVYMNL